jgi:hypothetical protein
MNPDYETPTLSFLDVLEYKTRTVGIQDCMNTHEFSGSSSSETKAKRKITRGSSSIN